MLFCADRNNTRGTPNSLLGIYDFGIFSVLKDASSRDSRLGNVDIFILMRLSWAMSWCFRILDTGTTVSISEKMPPRLDQFASFLSTFLCFASHEQIAPAIEDHHGPLSPQNTIASLLFTLCFPNGTPHVQPGQSCCRGAQRAGRRRHISYLQEDTIRFWAAHLAMAQLCFRGGVCVID